MKTFQSNAVRTYSTLGSSFLLLAAVGCATVHYNRITTDKEDVQGDGIRYYDSSPYLLVQRDTNSQWTAQALYLPDPTKKNQVKIATYLAVNSTSLTFSNAVLTQSAVTADSSAVPAAVVQMAAQVAISAAQAMKVPQSNTNLPKLTPPSVFLFKIIKDAKGWELTGASAPDLDLVKP